MFTSRIFTRSIAAAAAAAVIAAGVNTTANAAPRSAPGVPTACTNPIARSVCPGLPNASLPTGLDLGRLGLGSSERLDGPVSTSGVKLLTDNPAVINVGSPLTGLVLVAGATDPADGSIDVLLNGKPIIKNLPLVNIAGQGVGFNLSLPAELLGNGGALSVRYNGTFKNTNTSPTSAATSLRVSAVLLGTQFSGTVGTSVTYPSNPRITGTVVSKLVDTNLLHRLSALNGGASLTDSLVTPITPTGTVTAKVGTQAVGTATLNSSGGFSIGTTNFPAGSAKSVTLRYSGDPLLHSPSTTTVTVTKAKATTTLSSSISNKIFGSSSSVTVRLSRVTGGVTPTGTVTLKRGTAVVQARSLSAGTATFTLPARQSPGNYGYSVIYSSDANYNSTGAQTPVRIGKAVSRTTATITSPRYGVKPVVSIRVVGLDILSGSVAVVDGRTVIARGVVTAGKATVSLNKQYPAGRRSLVVKFAGTLTHAGSQASIVLTTTKATPAIKVVPDTHVAGTVTFRTTVTGVVPVGGRTTGGLAGRVTLSIVKPTIVSTVKVISVVSATAPRAFPFSVTRLPKGTYLYRIAYTGDINYFSRAVDVRVVVK